MSFRARYAGTCGDCETPIRPGQEVEFNSGSEVVHVECPEAELSARGELCDRCGLIHPGEC